MAAHVSVCEIGIKRNRVVLLGQVLADRDHAGEPIEHFPECLMVVFAPGYSSGCHAVQGGHDRTAATGDLIGVAAHEIPCAVSFVELLTPYAVVGADIAVLRIIENSQDGCVGMEHEIFTDEAAVVGETVGKLVRC